MNLTKYLVPVSWMLWGVVMLVLVLFLVSALIEARHSPEYSANVDALFSIVLLFVHAGMGLWLFRATRRRSSRSLIILTLLLAYPIVILVASPAYRVWDTWRFERELARVGDFPDPAAQALAERIQSGDIAGLQQLLAGGPPPNARDRAGNDLLAFAAEVVRDRDGNPETVRVLLEAGADPQDSRTPDGSSLLRFMVLDSKPSSVEVVRLLLQHGADPNATDPQTGMTAMAEAGAKPDMVKLLVEKGANIDQLLPGGESMLVRFISMQHWDSALYLIETGADLEVTNADGRSVDYYFKEFEQSVYGTHPEGWDKVRTAIKVRRE